MIIRTAGLVNGAEIVNTLILLVFAVYTARNHPKTASKEVQMWTDCRSSLKV
jgi:hypothetical protein